MLGVRRAILSGGLANVNVRLGDRVVRLYRRDPASASLEATLLGMPWHALRVPKVLSAGDGFLVSEYVEHGPLLGSAEHGAAAGRALAEVHSMRFESAGDLDPKSNPLRVGTHFGDLVSAFVSYATTSFEKGGLDATFVRAPSIAS